MMAFSEMETESEVDNRCGASMGQITENCRLNVGLILEGDLSKTAEAAVIVMVIR